MLFRPADMVYAILVALFSAGLAGKVGAESAEETKLTSVVTVRDVLGRETVAPDDRSWTGPLPVCFLYTVVSPNDRFEELQERRKESLFDRENELVALRDNIDRSSLDDSEAIARLNAMAWAIERYHDPGPAFAVANDAMPWLPVDRMDADRNIWWFDLNFNGEFSDERIKASGSPCQFKTGATLYSVFPNAVLKKVEPLCPAWDQSPSARANLTESKIRLPPTSKRPVLRESQFPSNANGWNECLVQFRRLQDLDSDERKERLPEIVTQANCALESKPVDRILLCDQMSHDPAWIPEASLLIAEILYRKGRALGYMELPSVIATRPIEDPDEHRELFLKTCDRLIRVIRENNTQRLEPENYGLLLVRRYRKVGDYGQALMLLSEMAEQAKPGSPADFWYTKKRRDLYGDLGWDAWREYEHHWMWRKFPAWTYALEYGVPKTETQDETR